jgi:hypothetical protein
MKTIFGKQGIINDNLSFMETIFEKQGMFE